MPPTVQDRVFDYLFTTKAPGKGTGLGLSISRDIVEGKHHGRLWVESAPGQGTTLTLELPIRLVSMTETKELALAGRQER
jgi:signal transduction histidine kinase